MFNPQEKVPANEETKMFRTNINYARIRLQSLANKAKTEPVSISTKNGSVVLIDEAEYRGLLLSAELKQNTKFLNSLIELANAPDSEFVDESEVAW